MGVPRSWTKAVAGLVTLCAIAQAQTPTSTATSSTSSSAQFTVPASADDGFAVIPNIKDPLAVDAQTECPGYIAHNVQQTASGWTASLSLAGAACNVYGTDIEDLDLTVEYQTSDRLHVSIQPTYLGASNQSYYLIPDGIVEKPAVEQSNVVSDLEFSWSNKPSFGFEVIRKSTKDVLFSTKGKKLVYENQFIEFASALPKNYNLYGLGESVHPFRIGNNYTKTYYNADAGATIDVYVYPHVSNMQ